MSASDSPNNKAGLKHWLYQVLPPLSLTAMLFVSHSGTTIAFLLGLLLIPVVISVISILVKLYRFRKKKKYLIRPALTIFMFVFLLSMIQITFEIAVGEARQEARVITSICNRFQLCPQLPAGWEVNGSLPRKEYTGGWLNYPAAYHVQTKEFAIHLYLMTDVGKLVYGGIGKAIKVKALQENQPIFAN